MIEKFKSTNINFNHLSNQSIFKLNALKIPSIMKLRNILCLAFLFTLLQASFSHPWKPTHYVIIDTDGGIDDIKAISMLLASPDVRVLAIIASGGTLDPGNTYIKIRTLLDSFHHEGLPLAINYNSPGENFAVPLSMIWGDESSIRIPPANNYIESVKSVIAGETSPIKMISLGSLNSANNLVKEGINFEYIVWSIKSMDPVSGMNYTIDRESADNLLKGNIPLKGVGYTGGVELYNGELAGRIKLINTRYAGILSVILENGSQASDHPFIRYGNDDLVPLFLHYPSLFIQASSNGNNSFFLPPEPGMLSEAIVRILKGETVNTNQVVKSFTSDSSYYMPDIQPYVKEIIDTHGIEEWSSGVLANELHRHLGVFAIVGVKMGIRAREYFHIGVDEMKLVSEAGSTPPLSCMNDGLQVSTGGTPGHGLLTVNNGNPSPSVDFHYKDRILRISLKPEIASMLSGELKEINYVYGLDSNIYWELVRQRSILYWKNLSRYDIFDITEIK